MIPGLWTASRRSSPLLGIAGAILLYLGVCSPVWGGAAESHARVVYHPPQLSVEAIATSLPQVLQAIGNRLGFAVVDMGASRTPLTLSIEAATLEEVLRQLLRAENHAILYRGQGWGKAAGGMERIILLGPRLPPVATPDPEHLRLEPKFRADITANEGYASGSWHVPPANQQLTSLYRERGWMQGEGKAAEDAAVKVEDLLRGHALAGVPEPPEVVAAVTSSADVNPLSEDSARPAVAGSPSRVANVGLALDIDATLALTTRLAQQNLKALVDGLKTATTSLLDSSAAQDK